MRLENFTLLRHIWLWNVTANATKKKRNSQSDLKKKVLLSTSYDSVSKCVDQMKSDIELFTLSISITCNHYYFENISKFFCHAAWHCWKTSIPRIFLKIIKHSALNVQKWYCISILWFIQTSSDEIITNLISFMSEWKKRLFQLINHDYRGRKKIYKQKKTVSSKIVIKMMIEKIHHQIVVI